MGCSRSCVKCLSLVPWASLIALAVCWAGTALFCGTGHEALTLFNQLLDNASIAGYSSINDTFQGIKYALYGVASFMFVMTILLLVDGILATRATKKEIEFTCRTKKCGICGGIFYSTFTFLLSTAWLLISVIAGFPVYFFQVSNSQCNIVGSGSNPYVCIDFVQTGLMSYKPNATQDYGRLCGDQLDQKFCNADQYDLTYQMFLIAFAGACIVVLGLKQFLMALSANFAYIKMSRKLADYQDTKFREQMELNQIIETARSNERLTYNY